MLYVFHVDCGRMMKFDMNLALSSVQNLKETIERFHGLPAANQVLLVSGGDILLPTSLVCSYSAGTDTNPIFMFTTIDAKNLQLWPSTESDIDHLKEQVDRCLKLPATYSTVVARAQLAQQIYEQAREEEIVCEKLVHEQHLQQLGWSAVIANMEDLTEEFKQRYENFCKSFDEHLSRRVEYLEFLVQFNDDLERLAKIPILPGLMPNAEQEFHGFDEFFENDEVYSSRTQQNSSSTDELSQSQTQRIQNATDNPSAEYGQASTDSQKSRLTLLQWISAKENHKPLKAMADECSRGLDLFDEKKFELLKQKFQSLIKQAEQDDFKEIKGLEDRLHGLDKLIHDLKKKVQDQKELATAFQQNQNRASNLNDASILPDLCASHRSQLLVMLQHQKQIRDIRKRISKAKDELGGNLSKRLKYIVIIENSMSELDNNFLFNHRCLRRIQRHLSIIEQIHQAPSIYVTAVIEVVRRRLFSSSFLVWSSDLAYDLLAIYNDEIMRRQEFSAIFEGHFLNTLFPGMDDLLPAFANEAPSIFDSSLPSLTTSDIDVLSSYLPELTSKIQLPDLGDVIKFFTSRSSNKSQEKISLSDAKVQSTEAGGNMSTGGGGMSGGGGGGVLLHRPIDVHSHLKDGFESETDTEEFEKVGQSPNERRQLSAAKTTNTIGTSTLIIQKPETMSTSTSTDVVLTHSIETLTESNAVQQCPPKKPPRLTKLLSTTTKSSVISSLPVIPEVCSPLSYTNDDSESADVDSIIDQFNNVYSQYSNTKNSPMISFLSPQSIHSIKTQAYAAQYQNKKIDQKLECHRQGMPTIAETEIAEVISNSSSSCKDHQYQKEQPLVLTQQALQMQFQQQHVSPSSPYPINNYMIDNEFVNSEFYIDESLPSSLNDDENDPESYEDVDYDYQQQRERAIREYAALDKRADENFHEDDDIDGVDNEDEDDANDDDDSTTNIIQNKFYSKRRITNNRDFRIRRHENMMNSSSIFNNRESLETVITLLQENLGSTRLEVERLKLLLTRMSQVSRDSLALLKKQLSSIRNESENSKDDIKNEFNKLSQTWDKIRKETERKEREIIQRLTIDHELEMNDVRKDLETKDDEIASLRNDKNYIEASHLEIVSNLEKERDEFKNQVIAVREKLNEYEMTVKNLHSDCQKAVHECKEQLLIQHKTELESLRCRFKLMTNTDEKQRWESNSSFGFSSSEQLIFKKEIEDKEKQLDALRDQQQVLLKENNDIRMRIESVTNKDENEKCILREKLEYLAQENHRLEQVLITEKLKRVEMESSIAIMKGTYISSGPDAIPSVETRNKPSKPIVSIDSCAKGDIVFIVWNSKHGQYTIVQESSALYFLHGDSLRALNLSINPNTNSSTPEPLFDIGQVIDKEYCQARKNENRYRVSKGTKFYRVKVQRISKPTDWSGGSSGKRERNESTSSSQSGPASRSTSTHHLIDSFAQTECVAIHPGRDMVDSGVSEQRSELLTRTISVTEEDEPITLLDERFRYISVSEEDEKSTSETVDNQDCTTVNQQRPTEGLSEKDQDDSDEYRSLEAKDELEFTSNIF